MHRIGVLCPSRGRPALFRRMVASCFATARHPESLQVLGGIDRDDPEIENYRDPRLDQQFVLISGEENVIHEQMERMSENNMFVPDLVSMPIGYTVSQTWNALRLYTDADILLMGNDDQIFETVGWDDVLRGVFAQYPDGIVCAWFNDDINGPSHCAFPAVSRRWVETVGYFAPTVGFRFFRNDTWIYDLARRIGRCHYIPEVSVRHEHHTNGGLQDATTMRNRSSGQGAHDQRVWVETVSVRERDAAKLKAAIESWEPVA